MVFASQLEEWNRLTGSVPSGASPCASNRSPSAPGCPSGFVQSSGRQAPAVRFGSAADFETDSRRSRSGTSVLDRTVAASYVSRRQGRLHGALDALAEEQARSSRGLLSSSLMRSLPSLGRPGSVAESCNAFSPEERDWTAPSWQARSGLNSRWYPHPVHSRGNLQLSKPGLLELGVDPLHDRANKCPMWDGGHDRFLRNSSMPEAKPRTPLAKVQDSPTQWNLLRR